MKKFEKYDVTILYIATILGLGFSFLGSVFNSKMLSKEQFGDWKYIQNYLMLINFFLTLGFYYSGGRLIAATNDARRIALLKGYMLYITVACLFLMFIVTLLLGFFWEDLLNKNIFHLMLLMFPLFITQPLTLYFESIFQSERKMISYSIYKVVPPLLYLISLYIFQSHSNGSIYYNAFLYFITYFIVLAFFIFKDKYVFKGRTNELNELINENKTYGIHLFYGSIWNVGASYLLPILIGLFNINNAEVGNYSLALSFVIPFSFLPSIVGTSYFKEFINLPIIPKLAFKNVVLLCFALLVATYIGIDYFIDLFLGVKYKEVALLVKIGAIGGILQGLGDFTNKFLSAKGDSPYIKKVAIIVGIVQLLTSLLFIKWFSSTGAMVAKTIGSAIYFILLYHFYNKNYLKKSLKLRPS